MDEAARAAVARIRDQFRALMEARRDGVPTGAREILETLVTIQISRTMLQQRSDAGSRIGRELISLASALEHTTEAVLVLAEQDVDIAAEQLGAASMTLLAELAQRTGVTVEVVPDGETSDAPEGPTH
jgi:hypothetical protein